MIATEELQHVDLSALRRRLIGYGWKPMKRDGVLQAPSGKYFLLPRRLTSDLDLVSLRLVIEAVMSDRHIQTLRELQHRIEGLKEDLLFLGCEIVGFSPGKLPAPQAPSFYTKSNRFLKASALSLQADRQVTAKKGIYERMTYGETKASSYLVAVHVPIDTIPDPIGRAFVQKTVAAVESLSIAVDRVDHEVLRDNVQAKWTAEMCEAVLGFVEDRTFSEFKFQAAPDPIWTGEPVNTSEFIIPLKTGAAEQVLQNAAASLRQLKPSERVEVVGMPFESRDYSVIGEGDKRTVGILWKREGAPDMRVHAEMSQSTYEQMLAFQSKRTVRVSGWLRQVGSRWVLEVEGEPSLLDIAASYEADLSWEQLLSELDTILPLRPHRAETDIPELPSNREDDEEDKGEEGR